MKKLTWLFPLFLAACGGGGSSGTHPVNPPGPPPRVDNLACEEVKLLGRMYSGTSAKFYVNTLILAMETFASQCSPQEAAAVLDKNFNIECSDICVVKEK
ncbi:hypothetical protein [uncultured Bdellovibrio sp.]|uniref:hypothetical protein n=1 Tax=Bdellovibrio sp. HCB-162 TaxID=3394234 RepID=UPI0025FF63A6|nr:hypothetical protein [uncultured Bdellovibrio sp.]